MITIIKNIEISLSYSNIETNIELFIINQQTFKLIDRMGVIDN